MDRCDGKNSSPDASIALLSETTSRNLLYVAMTRGRHANHAHIYQRVTEADEFSHEEPTGAHFAHRGDSREAAALLQVVLANDEPAITAHDYAAYTPKEELPDRIRSVLDMRVTATQHRQEGYQIWKAQRRQQGRLQEDARKRQIDRGLYCSADYGVEL